jgi:hypothetical protein
MTPLGFLHPTAATACATLLQPREHTLILQETGTSNNKLLISVIIPPIEESLKSSPSKADRTIAASVSRIARWAPILMASFMPARRVEDPAIQRGRRSAEILLCLLQLLTPVHQHLK